MEIASGPLQETGEALHVAMADKTVMSVQAADGNVAFTRRGDISISADGFLSLKWFAGSRGRRGPDNRSS